MIDGDGFTIVILTYDYQVLKGVYRSGEFSRLTRKEFCAINVLTCWAVLTA